MPNEPPLFPCAVTQALDRKSGVDVIYFDLRKLSIAFPTLGCYKSKINWESLVGPTTGYRLAYEKDGPSQNWRGVLQVYRNNELGPLFDMLN